MTDAQSEFVARFGDRGPKGDQGKQGDPGPRLPRGQARAVVWLAVLNLLFAAACFGGLLHYVDSGNADRCETIRQVVAIPAPRASWETRFEAIERHRLAQLGCGR